MILGNKKLPNTKSDIGKFIFYFYFNFHHQTYNLTMNRIVYTDTILECRTVYMNTIIISLIRRESNGTHVLSNSIFHITLYSSNISLPFFALPFNRAICSFSICCMLFSGVGKSSGIVPPNSLIV